MTSEGPVCFSRYRDDRADVDSLETHPSLVARRDRGALALALQERGARPLLSVAVVYVGDPLSFRIGSIL